MRRLALLLTAAALTAAVFGVPANATTDLVLCDGQTFDGYTTTPIRLGDRTADTDPAVRKVIRGCTFRNSNQTAILVVRGANVLITGSTFSNIHSGQVGVDVAAIRLRGVDLADGVRIEDSYFADISGDGIGAAISGNLVRNLSIAGNTFRGHVPGTLGWEGGENAIDLRAAQGPVTISGNDIEGFRPCESGMECSGGPGAGIRVNGAQGVTVTGNRFHDNLAHHLKIVNTTSCTVGGNTYTGPGEVLADGCASPSPSPSAPAPTPTPTPPPATPAPTVAPTPSPTVPWWCRWFPALC